MGDRPVTTVLRGSLSGPGQPSRANRHPSTEGGCGAIQMSLRMLTGSSVTSPTSSSSTSSTRAFHGDDACTLSMPMVNSVPSFAPVMKNVVPEK